MSSKQKPSRLFETLVPASIRGMQAFYEAYAEPVAPVPAVVARRIPTAERKPKAERNARVW